MKTLLGFLFLVLLILPPKAQAYGSYRSSYSSGDDGWLIMPSGVYFWTTQTQGTSTTVTRAVADITAGYHFNLFYLGAEYNYDQEQTTANSTATSTNTYKSYGAELGIMTDTVFLTFSYFIGSSGTYKGGTSSEVDYTNGTGYRVALGYLFDLGSNWSMGPQFDYKSITYTSISTGAAANPNFTFSTFLPEVALKYKF